MDDQRIEQWGRERFSAALSTIERFDQGHKIVYYSWLPDGIASSVDSRLATISVSQIDKITFEQVVAVLGVPEGVCTEVMRTDATYLDLGLYYPERGLIIWNRDVIQQDAVEVELVGDSQVLYVTCYGQAPRQALECLGLLPQTVDPWPGFGGTVSLHRP